MPALNKEIPFGLRVNVPWVIYIMTDNVPSTSAVSGGILADSRRLSLSLQPQHIRHERDSRHHIRRVALRLTGGMQVRDIIILPGLQRNRAESCQTVSQVTLFLYLSFTLGI